MSLVLPADLTAVQAAIWLDQQLFAGKPIYNTGQAISIPGALRFDLFEIALRATVAESPGLQLPPRSGPLAFDLGLLDFRKESDPVAAANRWMRTEMGRAIPLDDLVLFRFALIRVSDVRLGSTAALRRRSHRHRDIRGRDRAQVTATELTPALFMILTFALAFIADLNSFGRPNRLDVVSLNASAGLHPLDSSASWMGLNAFAGLNALDVLARRDS